MAIKLNKPVTVHAIHVITIPVTEVNVPVTDRTMYMCTLYKYMMSVNYQRLSSDVSSKYHKISGHSPIEIYSDKIYTCTKIIKHLTVLRTYMIQKHQNVLEHSSLYISVNSTVLKKVTSVTC